jgi:hypothetical protein
MNTTVKCTAYFINTLYRSAKECGESIPQKSLPFIRRMVKELLEHSARHLRVNKKVSFIDE